MNVVIVTLTPLSLTFRARKDFQFGLFQLTIINFSLPEGQCLNAIQIVVVSQADHVQFGHFRTGKRTTQFQNGNVISFRLKAEENRLNLTNKIEIKAYN